MDSIVPGNLSQCAFDFDALTDQPADNNIPQAASVPYKKQKYCPGCETYYPSTLEFFHRREASQGDKLNNVCKTCNTKKSSAYKAKKRKERPPKSPKTHCKHGHPLVEGNLRLHGGHYECLTCHREQEKARQRKQGVKERVINDCCPQGHPLVEGNLKKSGKNKGRHCLTCHRESAKRRYHKDPQKMVAEATAYAKAHRKQINERFRGYRKQEIWKQRAKASSFRQSARQGRRSRESTINRQLYADKESKMYLDMILKDPCAYCGRPMEEIDHIVPLTRGGTEHWTNLTSACKRCNVRKRNRSLLQFYLYRLEYPD